MSDIRDGREPPLDEIINHYKPTAEPVVVAGMLGEGFQIFVLKFRT